MTKTLKNIGAFLCGSWSKHRAEKATEKKISQDDRTAISNIEALQRAEIDTLLWVYHREGNRFRTRHDYPIITSLVQAKILIQEDPNAFGLMRFFRIRPVIFEGLEKQLGNRNPHHDDADPPWWTSDGRIG
jgi:hypothetical protein